MPIAFKPDFVAFVLAPLYEPLVLSLRRFSRSFILTWMRRRIVPLSPSFVYSTRPRSCRRMHSVYNFWLRTIVCWRWGV